MKSTIEPVAKATSRQARCKTPFSNSLPWPIPYHPRRERCQEVVTEQERADAAEILADLRANEAKARDNDIAGRTQEIKNLEAAGRPDGFITAQKLRKEVLECEHEAFLVATAEIRERQEEAAAIVTTILSRLVDSFTEELNALLLAREADLLRLDFPIVEERMPEGNVFKDGSLGGRPSKHWVLLTQKEVVAIHSCLGLAKHLLAKFVSGENGYTRQEIVASRAIEALKFFCTSEAAPGFSWV